MKTLFISILILVCLVLRLNLPENQVTLSYTPKVQQDLVSELKEKFLNSDVVADWVYRDFVLVKFACSERMDKELIGLPFKKWRVYNGSTSLCKLTQ